jgi:hypothetical protein
VPQHSADLDKDLASGKANMSLSAYRENVHLIAAHMHDYETAQLYAKSVWRPIRNSKRSRPEDVDVIEEAVALDDMQIARAQIAMDKAKAKLGIEPDATMSNAELTKMLAEVKRIDGEEVQGWAAQLVFERADAKSGKKRDKLGELVDDTPVAGQSQSMIAREMRAKFLRAIEGNEIKLTFKDVAAKQRLGLLVQQTGESLVAMTERLRSETITGVDMPSERRWPEGATITSSVVRRRKNGRTEIDIIGRTMSGHKLRKRVLLPQDADSNRYLSEMCDYLVGGTIGRLSYTTRVNRSGRFELDVFVYKNGKRFRLRRYCSADQVEMLVENVRAQYAVA